MLFLSLILSLQSWALTPPSPEIIEQIAPRIFLNETACKKENLVFWNSEEAFPSLGVGHAIWFPENVGELPYKEGFPDLIQFLRQKSQTPLSDWPTELQAQPLGPAPWKDREEFLKTDLDHWRNFFAAPEIMKWQVQHMLQKTLKSLKSIEKSWQGATHQKDRENLHLLLKSADGWLSLIDYVNFKGDGLAQKELSPHGKFSWGLKVVLEKMKNTEPTTPVCDPRQWRYYNTIKCANYRFAEAARWSLERMVHSWTAQDNPEFLRRKRWLEGSWSQRILNTYTPGSAERALCEWR